MTGRDPLAITLGIEEEFFLVDPETRDLVADPNPAIFDLCRRNAGPHKVVNEFLRSQIESNTKVCSSVAELRQALIETRRLILDAAGRFGATVMASSTHPFANWRVQSSTPKERYRRFEMDFQDSVRRFLVGGMHVHAGFGDKDSRVRVMTALRRHLPLLHALSTSSPFSSGRETGFKSSRLNLIGMLPRTSLPPPLGSGKEFDALVEGYRELDFIEDGSELWWDIRPSATFPTVEMRICDVCPRLDEAIGIAALYACLVRRTLRLERAGKLPAEPATELLAENRWMASRYGVLAFFGDTEEKSRKDISEFVTSLIADLAEDARALDCEAELARIPQIILDGAAADRQLDLFRLRRLEGDSDEAALRAVVDLALAETREGVVGPEGR